MKNLEIVEIDKDRIYDLYMFTNFIGHHELTYSDWNDLLRAGTKVWYILDNGKIIASGSLTFYGNDAHQTDYTKASVAVLTNCQVHPQYRGRGLQQRLITHRVAFALKNNILSIQSLVQVENIYSIQNLLKTGFSNIGKYDELGSPTENTYRFVYKRELHLFYWKIRHLIENFGSSL